MKRFMERTAAIMENYADRVAFCDMEAAMTYGELDRASGRVYAHLKKRGIGREDFVLLVLPRGILLPAAILGVWKTGAAVVALEDTYPADRVAFIREDVRAKLVLDEASVRGILADEEPLAGYEQTGLHDAAYAIYTSGSTGTPKGVLHEYGNLDQCGRSIPEKAVWKQTAVGMVEPFYFIAGIMRMIWRILQANTLHIIPRAMARNYRQLTGYIREQRLGSIFLSPSYLRLFKEPGPSLEEIETGSEPANGIYYEGGKPVVVNHYSMSEAGFPVLECALERGFDIAPVGRPVLEEIDLHLADEEGRRVIGPGRGEICFRNEYVRGYINLPEKTAEVFREGIYHTGDIADRDGDGLYYIVGRKDDMFKINGNRIEPAEIEARIRELTGLDQVAAKGVEKDGRSFVCAYYLKKQARELGIEKDGKLECDLSGLRHILPQYMIPSYYIGLDEFPVNANGKMVRRNLPEPQTDLFRSAYREPRDELEKTFCGAMGRVLGQEKVGADDDFYLVGGDSIGAIRLIEECARLGYELPMAALYENRTPAGLARFCEKSAGTQNALKKQEELKRYYRKVLEKAAEPIEGRLSYYGSVLGFAERLRREAEDNPSRDYWFDAPVDPDRLQHALDQAAAVCPYVLLCPETAEHDWHIRFRENKKPLLAHPLLEREQFGTDENNGHYCSVGYEGNRVRFRISHCLTDGAGFEWFIQAVLAYYFNTGAALYSGAGTEDYSVDLMAEEIPSDEAGEEPWTPGFSLPEKQDAVKGTPHYFTFCADAQAVDTLCAAHGISRQMLIGILLGRAVMKAHPENTADLIVRSPVNTRSILGFPDTWQNASLPHSFLRMAARDLADNRIEALASSMNRQFAEQISRSHLAAETNRFARAAREDTPGSVIRLLVDYRDRAGLFVSDLGKMADDDVAGHVEKMESAFKVPYTLMIYCIELNRRLILTYAQSFDNMSCKEAFEEIWRELFGSGQ